MAWQLNLTALLEFPGDGQRALVAGGNLTSSPPG
jgi:hypothetical protein